MAIDAHQHFWRYDPSAYGWLSDSMAALRRDFLPADLKPELERAGVSGSVAVQAVQTLGETRFLLEQARANPFVLGVVGWIPLARPGAGRILERFAADPLFKGCRHVLQDEPDDRYMLRADFNAGLRELTARDLPYDILVYERHLPATIEFVDRHPDQPFVLDHLGKPRVRDGAFSGWRRQIRSLARRERVCCKVSGLATEAHWESWSESDLEPYLEAVLEAFGPERLMFGSDWPMCLPAVDYGGWHRLVSEFASRLRPSERASVLGGTAERVYSLRGGRSLQ